MKTFDLDECIGLGQDVLKTSSEDEDERRLYQDECLLGMVPFKRYEQLSELVKMCPCLYNKQEKDFTKEEVKQRAWKEIARELDLENGKVVEQLWNN